MWKARTRAARSLLSNARGNHESDDFDWDRYHLEYSAQIRALERSHTLRLEPNSFSIIDGSLRVMNGRPLHHNHKFLYEVILALKPNSILEAGCGGGDHLRNLALLMPSASVYGVDRSPEQLNVLARRNPEILKRSGVLDLTLPHPSNLAPADLVFCQAVLMHIQTGNGHRVALWNLFDLSRRQVVLVENPDRHDLIRDITTLHRGGIISWPTLHLYVNRDHRGTDIIVASQEPIESKVPHLRAVHA